MRRAWWLVGILWGCDGSSVAYAPYDEGEAASLGDTLADALVGVYDLGQWFEQSEGLCRPGVGTPPLVEGDPYLAIGKLGEDLSKGLWLASCEDLDDCAAHMATIAAGGRPAGRVFGWVGAAADARTATGLAIDPPVVNQNGRCEGGDAVQTALTSAGADAIDVSLIRYTNLVSGKRDPCDAALVRDEVERANACDVQFRLTGSEVQVP